MTRESGNRNLEYDYRQRTRLYFITNNTTLYEQYTYGADGHVVKRLNRSSGLIYSYVYIDGLFQYSDQIGHASNAQNHINILDPSGAIISQHRQGTFSGEVAYTNGELYMINNHVGSVIGTYDLNGTQQEGEDYYPFGDSSHHWNGNKQQRFAGKIRLSWTGYYDFGARQYIPWLAKFTSVDPLAAKSTDRNPYHYASNNPINRVDPSGMKDEPSGNGGGGDKKSKNNITNKSNNGQPAKQSPQGGLPEYNGQVGPWSPSMTEKGSSETPYDFLFEAASNEISKGANSLKIHKVDALKEKGVLGSSLDKNYQSKGKTDPKNIFDSPKWKQQGNSSYRTTGYNPSTPGTKLLSKTSIAFKAASRLTGLLDFAQYSKVLNGELSLSEAFPSPASFVMQDYISEMNVALDQAAIRSGYSSAKRLTERSSEYKMIYMSEGDYQKFLSGEINSVNDLPGFNENSFMNPKQPFALITSGYTNFSTYGQYYSPTGF
jgi:RHS repeat-associated protein